MAEYIAKEAAKALLRQHEHRFTCADEANGYGNVKWSEYVVYSDTAQNCIDAIPTADVAPVRHGRWKPGDMPTYGGFKCSLCKKNTIVYKPPYCPNCGAKMDGEA